ncbi:uncharacterized protein LOC101459867 [Ceratitis capitata]|uniref:uncharacterized protein LOC101459867 n=1 Tax=Ceratitis capitata TaxID=7213 RepID=UPI000329D900|nr:uncharacterized protein LOC101459867 [Ceratitis capitata]
MRISSIFGAILTTLCLQFYLKNALAKSNFEIIYSEINCTAHDPKGYLAKLSCRTGKSLKLSSLTVEFQFKKDIKYFGLDLRVILPRQSTDFTLLNLTHVNGCQLMANKLQVPLMQLVLGSLNRYGNLMQGCPYKRDTLYYIRGFRMDLNAMPAFAFDTGMKSWLSFRHEGDVLYTLFVNSRIQLRRSG